MWKAGLLRFHRYAGLVMAAFLLAQAITGALLVYRADVARLIDPAAMIRQSSAGHAYPKQLVEAAQRAMPGMVARRLYFPERSDGTTFVELADASGQAGYASVDPGNARVLRRGGLSSFPMEAALRLHYRLLLGPLGSAMIALNGCALLFLAATGLGYWWPRRGRVLRSLAVRRGSLFLRQLHRTTGVTIAAALILISTTGSVMAAQEALEAGSRFRPAALPLARLDAGLAQAQAVFPGAVVRDVRLSPDRIRVNFQAPEAGARAVHEVVIDLRGMTVERAIPAARNEALWATLLPLHTGDFAGGIGRALFALVALLLSGLAISGPLLWWQRRPSKRTR